MDQAIFPGYCAGFAFISFNTRPLFTAHGTGTTVCQQINHTILRLY